MLKNQPEIITDKWRFLPSPRSHVFWVRRLELSRRAVRRSRTWRILRSIDTGEHWEDISAGIEYVDIHTVKGDPQHANFTTPRPHAIYRSDQYGRAWVFSERGIDRSYFHDLVVIPGSRRRCRR